eukprot:TRINITY_DN253_c0_g1_i1.p1 TRINITY_DN253_c0_g1~~TRINITY_DN253_c0_g1_i1.p1  ORF type:complete len:324 (-),score=61.51 TRINITY_DN253_c0_g1_i1:911-1882(-)
MAETQTTGAFNRPPTHFRNVITRDGSSGYPPVAGRYWLYISLACPWAHRTAIVRKMKGLEDIIGMTVVKATFVPTRPGQDDHRGWAFAKKEGEEPHTAPDPINGATFIRDLYEISDAETALKGRFSVPVLWDTQTKKIVNNESSEIIRMFNSEFNDLCKNPELDLYPEELRGKIDEVNEWVYSDVNNGVYRTGFARTQEAYNQAAAVLFKALDRLESLLSQQRYLAGDKLTEADVRLFTTLIRFDEVYSVHFKCNQRLIREYENLFNYTKELYQVAGVKETVDFWHCRQHYYTSHEFLNPFGIVPVGSLSWIKWDGPHDRASK